MLKPSEREKLQDCLMLIQSARDILAGFTPQFECLTDVEKCFVTADEKLTTLLRL